MSPKRLAMLQSQARRQFEAMRANGDAAPLLLCIVDALGRIAAVIDSADWAADDCTPTARCAVEEVRGACAELVAAVGAARKLLAADFARRLDATAAELFALNARRGGAHRAAKTVAMPASGSPARRKLPAATPSRAAEVPIDTVSFGASAARSIAPGSGFPVRFVVYPAEQVGAARALLDSVDPRNTANTSLVGVGGAQVAQGALLQIALSGDGLSIEGAPRQVQTLCWSGRPVLLTFDVKASATIAGSTTVLRFDVTFDGLQLAWIRLQLDVAAAADMPAGPLRTSDGHRLARRAFASYASVDRQRVLDRVASIRINAGVDVFVDRVALVPGEYWQARLASEIDTCDTFMLFWSDAAKKSSWVRWEWERALKRPGLERIQLHPLKNGLRPPPELQAIHLADALMDIRTADVAARARRRPKEKQGG